MQLWCSLPKRGFLHNHRKVDEEFCLLLCRIRKKFKRPNQATQSTTVVATNEWKYHAELKLELDENLPLVPCNAGEINQVVLNLIVNGAHAIRDRFENGQKGLNRKESALPGCKVRYHIYCRQRWWNSKS